MTCASCCREFPGKRKDCPFCGFNNARRGGPRSERSLANLNAEIQDREDFERELAELTEEQALWLRWNEGAESESTSEVAQKPQT